MASTISICNQSLTNDVIAPYMHLNENFLTEEQILEYILQITNTFLTNYQVFDCIHSNSKDMNAISMMSIIDLMYDTLWNKPSSDTYLCDSTQVLIVGQILTQWLIIVQQLQLEEMSSEFFIISFTNNTEYLDIVRDLIYTVLDPCLYINDTLLKSTALLSVSVDSVITNDAMVYYLQANIRPFLSIVISNSNYLPIFYQFVCSIIDGFLENINIHFNSITTEDMEYEYIITDLSDLLQSVLHISELYKLTVAIPGEQFVTNDYCQGFEVFSTRISNGSLLANVTNVSISIGGDMFDNRESFANASESLSSFDVVIVGVKVSGTNTSVTVDGKCTEVGTLHGSLVSIIIISDLNTSELQSNISLTFECTEEENCECIYYDRDDSQWSSDGCTTVYSESTQEVLCTCSHLSTFATIRNIHDECSAFYESLTFIGWDIMHGIFALLFFGIFLWSNFQIYPFIRYYKKYGCKRNPVFVLILIAIISLTQYILCIEFYLLGYGWTDTHVDVITFLMLFPVILYFLIFSIIFYSWFAIAMSFKALTVGFKKHLRNILIIINFFCAVIILVQYTLLVHNIAIFLAFEVFWCTMLAFAAMSFTIYGISMMKLILMSTKMINYDTTSEEWDTAYRLLFTSGFICVYFVLQTLSVVYFTIYYDKLDIYFRAADIGLNFGVLCNICYMYYQPMKRVLRSKQQTSANPGQIVCIQSAHINISTSILKTSIVKPRLNLRIESNSFVSNENLFDRKPSRVEVEYKHNFSPNKNQFPVHKSYDRESQRMSVSIIKEDAEKCLFVFDFFVY